MKDEVTCKDPDSLINIDGEWKTLNEWCDAFDVKIGNVRARLRIGWTIEEALILQKRYIRDEKNQMKYRTIPNKEKKQRGCIYCADALNEGDRKSSYYVGRFCPHLRCPYHELDKYDDYGDYMKAADLNGFVKALEAFGLSVWEEEE